MTRPHTGWHFLQIPGPTNIPARVLAAMSQPTVDHRGPDFPALTAEILEGLQWVFQTEHPVIVFPGSGSGGWEAALVNTLSPGDRVLMYETGQFGLGWVEVARNFGLDVDMVPGDWRGGADPTAVEERLAADTGHSYKAVAVVHNETSTAAVTRIPAIRAAMDRTAHPALLMVDTVSSLGSIEYRHDEWGVDVAVAGSQKGLMLPAGLAFTAISPKALDASKTAALPRSYWDWKRMLDLNASGNFPYTPATNLFFGLRESLAMLREEGLEQVFRRHARFGTATRRAVEAWGLEVQCANPEEWSDVLTAVRLPDGHDADKVRAVILERFNLSLGAGLGKVKGRVLRIGHLGDFNDLMLVATLAGVESGLVLSGVPIRRGGVRAAMEVLEASG
ncbi:MAG TPA: aminotransferase class V-fold PLP-dependent enzyme [Longimicrobiales bacterium]|nr:aminotransferase class V-fold PLP-dependent enzyme [Longimicrobiales bacterium]